MRIASQHVRIFLKGYIPRYSKHVKASAIYVKNLQCESSIKTINLLTKRLKPYGSNGNGEFWRAFNVLAQSFMFMMARICMLTARICM